MNPVSVTIALTGGLIVLTIIAVQNKQVKIPNSNSVITQPSIQPNIIISPTPSANPQPSVTDNINDLQYPESKQISSDTWESSDSPQTVTEWYKQKIQSLGMNTTSFVQTSTNGNVLNKLVGSDGKEEIEVQITKSNKAQGVEIKLNVNN